MAAGRVCLMTAACVIRTSVKCESIQACTNLKDTRPNGNWIQKQPQQWLLQKAGPIAARKPPSKAALQNPQLPAWGRPPIAVPEKGQQESHHVRTGMEGHVGSWRTSGRTQDVPTVSHHGHSSYTGNVQLPTHRPTTRGASELIMFMSPWFSL